MKKINWKMLIVIFLPVILGAVVGFISDTSIYDKIIQPSFAPPAILFPIVWTILYLLMGISSYLILKSKEENQKAIGIYIIQLVVNYLWPIFFFKFRWFLISFLWLILLIVLVIKMIIEFFKIDKRAAYLQIPYLLWITFASILNLAIYILNR